MTGDGWLGHEPGRPGYRRLLVTMFAAGFATFAQLFDTQAVLPIISRDLGVSPATAALTVSATTVGLAASVLPWAAVADRVGRARAMKLSLAISSVVALLTPFLPSFELVVGARALVGAFLGAVPAVAMAYLAEEVRRDIVPVAATVYVAGNTLGGMTGRLIGGLVGEAVGWRVALVAVAALVGVSAVVFSMLSPSPRGFLPERVAPSQLLRRVLRLLRMPALLSLYLQGFLLMGAFTVMYNFLGYHLLDRPFRVPATFVSLLFLIYLTGTAASRFAAKLAMRVGVRLVVMLGPLAMIGGAALTLVPLLPVVLVGLALFTIGCFSAQPLASSLSGQMVVEGRAQATALYQLSWLAGTSLFGWVGGLVLDDGGWADVVLLIAILCGLAAILSAFGLRYESRPHVTRTVLDRRSTVRNRRGSRSR